MTAEVAFAAVPFVLGVAVLWLVLYLVSMGRGR